MRRSSRRMKIMSVGKANADERLHNIVSKFSPAINYSFLDAKGFFRDGAEKVNSSWGYSQHAVSSVVDFVPSRGWVHTWVGDICAGRTGVVVDDVILGILFICVVLVSLARVCGDGWMESGQMQCRLQVAGISFFFFFFDVMIRMILFFSVSA